jgi:preprotein translocase subunit SecB
MAENQTFDIQRLYIKDSSFESPSVPAIFREEWQPEVSIDLQTKSQILEGDLHEVVLTVTVTAKKKEKIIFLVEVKQAGIFAIKGFSKEQLGHMLGSFCPNVLFPYAREVVTDIAVRGGFPPLYLTPVNFDMLYAQHLEQQKQADTGKNDSDTKH